MYPNSCHSYRVQKVQKYLILLYMSDLLKLLHQNEVPTSVILEWNNLYMKEQKEVLRLKMRKHFSMLFDLGRLGKEYSLLKDDLDNLSIKIKERNSIKNNNLWLFITISPRFTENFEKCHKIIQKIVKKTCFDDYLYVVEQRGTIAKKNVGHGFHFHILAKRSLNYKPSKCSQNVRNSTKNICGNSKDNRIVNIQKCGMEFAKTKVNYIIGKNKTGDGKDLKQDADLVFRKQKSLSPYYGNIHIADSLPEGFGT